jgi:hypothetical protein
VPSGHPHESEVRWSALRLGIPSHNYRTVLYCMCSAAGAGLRFLSWLVKLSWLWLWRELDVELYLQTYSLAARSTSLGGRRPLGGRLQAYHPLCWHALSPLLLSGKGWGGS